jgi:hypothetical protein
MEALLADVFATAPPATPATSSPYGSPKHTAAEQEWLQEEKIQSVYLPSIHPLYPIQPTERFDWRLRASSRIRHLSASSSEREKFVRRKQPPQLMLEKGHLFYDAIRSYEER